MIRILLFEDNKNYREALEEAFAFSKQVCLSKSFENASRVISRVKEYEPDVVLMDIQMPGKSGLDALAEINDAQLDTKVMIQTQYKDPHSIFVALCRGALGYALKSDPFDKIESAITQVYQGGGYFSPSIAGKVARLFQNKKVQKQPEYIPLTKREKEVLSLLVKALKYQDIANQLFISYEAVHTHIRHIYKKLHVSSRSEAILKAIESKLV